MTLPEYHHEETRVIGWPQFYVQQNAGIWPVTAPIARIAKSPGARLLEIGGGYGFGLDFAIYGRGWTGLGIDPSPLAERGRIELGLPVRVGYFPQEDLGDGEWDVIVATEVIEHTDHPSVLLSDIRKRIAPDGVLLLTTPDGGAIRPETPYTALEQILVPEIHMVFQTIHSLDHILRAAGFEHVSVTRDAYSVVAFASLSPLDLDNDPKVLRTRFRTYLDQRSKILDPISDAGIGLLGRAMFEATNDGDFTAATTARALLFPAVLQRFGLDLSTLENLPEAYVDLQLAQLKDYVPFNLGPVMFAEAMRRIGEGEPRRLVARELRIAEQAATVVVRTLRKLWLTDSMSENIAWLAQAERAIALAEAADPGAVAAFAALPTHGEADAARRSFLWRGLIELTNAGAVDEARTLIAKVGLKEPENWLSTDLLRNARIVLGHLALAEDGDPLQAVALAEVMGEGDPIAADLLLGGFIRLVNASRYGEAALLTLSIENLVHLRSDRTAIDASLALITVALLTGDPALIPALLDRLPNLSDAARQDACAQAALRLIHLGRAVEARPIMAGIDLALLDPASRIDVIAAEAGLAIDAHDIEILAATLDALDADGAEIARVKSLAVQGFTAAVNRGEFAAARLLQHRIEPDFRSFAHATTDTLRSAGYALGVLALQEPAQPYRAETAFAAVRRGYVAELADGATAPALFWESLRGEIIALHATDRAAEASALRRAMLARYVGAPHDLTRDRTEVPR
jgi:SAM-dependent methyltransferase